MKKNHLFFILICLIGILSLTACGGRSAYDSRSKSVTDEYSAAAPAMAMKSMAYDFEDSAVEGAYSAAYGEPAPTVERMIIKDGSLTIRVDDPVAIADVIAGIAVKYDGFVVSNQISEDYTTDKPRATVQIRVDAERFENALADIEALVTDPNKNITDKFISGDDITDQYVDQESRLRSLENKKAKLEEILSTAKTVKDTLAVYEEIADVDERIELTKGQMKYMEQSSKLSSITVNVKAIPDPIVIAGHEWHIGDSFRTSINAFIETGQDLIDVIIYFVIATLPFLIIIILPIYLILRWIIKRTKKNSKANPPTLEE